MNSLIKQIFKDFEVNGVKIPVSFLRYNGTSTTYITYQELNAGVVLDFYPVSSLKGSEEHRCGEPEVRHHHLQ